MFEKDFKSRFLCEISWFLKNWLHIFKHFASGVKQLQIKFGSVCEMLSVICNHSNFFVWVCALFIFYFFNLSKGLSILLIFKKLQLNFKAFSVVFLFSMSFLILIISFILLIWGFFSSYFSFLMRKIIVVQSLCRVWLCDSTNCSRQASLSFTVYQRLVRFMSPESVMLSKHLILFSVSWETCIQVKEQKLEHCM